MSVGSVLPRLSAVLVGALSVALVPGAAEATVSSTPQAGMPAFNGPVLVTRTVGSTTYVGGDFTEVVDGGGAKARAGAAAFDSVTGKVLRWNPRVTGVVRDIEVAGNRAFLVGDFDAVRGQSRRNFARVASSGGGRLHAPKRSFNGVVNAVEVDGRTVYVGGDFTKAGRKQRTRLAALTRSGKLKRWAPSAQSGQVYDLEATKQGVYVAGEFNFFNGRTRDGHLTLVHKRNGTTVRAFNPAVERPVFDIEARKAIYAAAGGAGGGAAWKVDRRSGSTTWRMQFDGDVQAVTLLAREVYVGGHFTALCNGYNTDPGTGGCLDGGVPRKAGASFRPSGELTDWNPAVNSPEGIVSLSAGASPGRLVAGGHFTLANNGTADAQRVAVFRP